MARKLRPAVVLRASRSLLVLVCLALGLALVYLPAQPGTAIAETAPADAPSESPALTPEPTSSPDFTDSTPPVPTVDPSVQPTAAPSPSEDPPLEPGPTDAAVSPEPSPLPSVSPTGPLTVTHFAFALVQGDDLPLYRALDAGLFDQPRFEVARIRFELANSSPDDVTLIPLLQVAGAEGDFTTVSDEPGAAAPFRAAAEWIRRADGGTQIGPALVASPADAARPEVVRSSGVNPMPAQVVPGSSVLSVEFSVSATAAAAYGATYILRLSNGGVELAGMADAALQMEPRPPLDLSPGQRRGSDPESPARAGTRYRLTLTSTSVHTPSFDLVSDSCVACHRAHTAPGTLLTAQTTEYALCASCHNGTDLPDIADAYSGVPANDAASRAYYQHDPSATSGVLGQTNDCAECHNPHNISSTAAAETVSGWTASGRLAGVSGVELEYQLCYRCHASPATLPSNSGQPPSRYALDKAVEFDPSNASYHPIESAGTNGTTQMDASLAGTSPYKLWNFTSASTVRCVNCHADGRLATAALGSGSPLGADADLPVHASTQRGILLAPYQDRTLNGPIEPYQAADFALCYLCHAEAPFVDGSGEVRADTNFRYHGLHVSNAPTMLDRGFPGTDIDTAGYGSGFAVCAECHFRIHSSALPADGKTPGLRLVNFAPNVIAPTGVTLGWQPRNGVADGSCTVKCHGAPHNGVDY